MRLSADDLKQLAECAVIAAKEAGALIAHTNGREVAIQHKDGGESLASQVVTEACWKFSHLRMLICTGWSAYVTPTISVSLRAS
jgi:hypothetical protein